MQFNIKSSKDLFTSYGKWYKHGV